MASPILNEQILLQQLNPDGPHEADADEMRTAFALTLMNAYDRKVEREFMWDLIVQTFRAVTCLKQIEIVGHVEFQRLKAAREKGETVEAGEDFKSLVRQLRGIQRRVHDKLVLVAQCPTDEDRIS